MSSACESSQGGALVDRALRASRLTLTMRRPDAHNALNVAMMEQLQDGLAQAQADERVRYVVLAGQGKSFCAGADLSWMKTAGRASPQRNRADAAQLSDVLTAMVTHPKPVLARVHGAALGGGMGLAAACDLVVAAPHARFGLTEVRLGLVPALIFPFLLRRVQRQHLLWAALTGERFTAQRAWEMGLVNEVSEDLDAVIDGWGASLCAAAPGAVTEVKRLFHQTLSLDWDQARDLTTEMIARVRAGAEAQEGIQAFLDRRDPSWCVARAGHLSGSQESPQGDE